MLIKNIKYANRDGEILCGNIEITEGIITDITPSEAADDDGLLLLPGFVDIHSHGGSGRDFCDGNEESLAELSMHYARHGVTSVCPTTMTLPGDVLEGIFTALAAFKDKEKGARFLGVNMEGPFISKAKCGAQDPKNAIPADIALFDKLNGIYPIALVDVAPETENALPFAEYAKDKTVVSIAHTNATYEEAFEGIRHGFSHATHFLNAMTPFTSRAPGVAGAVLESNNVTAELICDGYHLNEGTLRILFKLLGEDRIAVISDSLSSADYPDGEYTLGGQAVFVREGKAHLADGTIAGSTSNLFDEFKNLLSFGVPFESALKSCSITPARIIGADSLCGSIEEGKNADFILVDRDMNITNVMVGGEFLF